GPHTGAVVVAAGAAAFRVVEATRFASRSRSEEVGACGPRSGPRYDGRPPYRASLAVGAGALAGRGVVRVGFHSTSPEPPPSPESALVAGSASAGEAEAGRGTVVAALAAERGCHARCVLSSAVYRTQIPASAWPDEYPARLGARGRRRRGSVVATGEATSPATTPLRRHPASLGHRERRRRHGLPGAALHVLDVRLVPVAAWREVGGELDVKTGLLARRQGAELHGAEAVLRDG